MFSCVQNLDYKWIYRLYPSNILLHRIDLDYYYVTVATFCGEARLSRKLVS